MATLRDMGLVPRTIDSAPTLRDAGLVPRAAPDVSALVDQASANSMGQIQKGWTSARMGGEVSSLAADESSLRAQGRTAEADALAQQGAALQQRARAFAPAEQDVTTLNLSEPGRAVDWALGSVGAMPASMVEPMAASTMLGGAGRALGSLRSPVARAAGGALSLAAPAAAWGINARQMKGEFYGAAKDDPTILRDHTPQEIDTMGNVYGGVAGLVDTALPHAMASRLIGKPGLRALGGTGMLPKTLLDQGGEAATEGLQTAGQHLALGQLNPLRDTSKDTNEIINAAASAFVGSGPMSAASHLASKGHARLDVKDDPNNDVSDKGTADKAEPKAGDSFSDVLRRGTSERKARAGSDAEVKAWKDTLEGLGSEDPLEGAALQHAALVKELSGRVAKGETGAQEHLDAVSAENPNDPLQMAEDATRNAAAKYLIGDGSDEEAIKKVMKAYEGRKLNTQVDYGDLGGRTGAGEPIAQNDPARAESIVRYREMGQRARLTADVLTKALPKKMQKYAKVAASLGQELAHFSGEGYEKPSAGDTARVLRMGAQLVHLYGGEKAHALVTEAGRTANIEGTKLFKALNASVSVAREDVGAYQKAAATSREAAADQLVRALPPDAELRLRKDGHDLTDPGTREHLLGMVEDVFDGTGMSEMALREAIGDKAFEAVREVVGQPIEPRKKIDKQTEETVDATDTPETKTPTESDEDTGDAGLEDGDTWAQEGAGKSMDRAPGARQYFFHGRDVPADGATVRNPFVASGKNGLPTLATLDRTDHDGVNSLQRMEEKARELLGFDPNAVKTVTRRGKGMRDGRKTSVVQNKAVDTGRDARHEVNVVSAKSVMDYAGMQDSKRAEVFNNYLEKDGHKPGALAAIQALDQQIADLTAKTPKIKISAGKKTRNPEYVKLEAMRAERWGLMKDLAAAADVRKNAVTGKDELGRDTRERDTVADTLSQDSTAADLVNAYFNDRHLVVADEVGVKDHLRMVLGKLREMTLRGERDIAFAAKVAKENGHTPAEREALRKSVEADMNLIRFKTSFTKGEADVAVRASAIVAWVRENKIEYDKPDRKTADSEALDFRNALMSGISAMLADGFMESTPYMKDADGKVQKFGEGERKFPDTLKLGTLTQAALVMRAKDARDKIIAADAAMTPKQRHKKRESARRAAATKVAAEQGVEEEVDHDKGVPDEFRHPGKERGADDALATDKRDARERFWDAPEQEDNRQERDRVPSEAEPEQKPGAMPTDYTDTAMRSSVMNTERDVPTLTAENAMAKAKGYAEMLLGGLRKDAKAGVERIKRVARMMDAPRWVPSGSDKAVGGKFYAAPLAHLLTPALVKAHSELSAVRSHVADVLTKTDQGAPTGAQKIVLAKKLNGETALDAAEAAERKKAAEIGQPPLPIDPRDHLLGEKRIAGINAAEAFLEGLSWAHRKAGKAERKKAGTQRMTVKAEPAAKAAPKINIWHGSGENAELSNLASRPFEMNGHQFLSVEHAYQSYKSGKFDPATFGKYTKAGQKIAGGAGTKTADGWNLTLMKKLISESFKQNPAAAEVLRSTGKTEFSHTQDTGVWAKEFPRILAEVRGELRAAPKVESAADKASAWAAKQLTGDASTITARNALLKRLGERMAGMTNAQVDALYDAVSNDDVPEGVHKAVWSQAAELARLESDKRDAAARKAEIEGQEPAPTRKLNTQLNPAAHLSATVQAVAQTRSLMRLLGFKSAPAQFASVAEKLLTDPTQNPDAFIKESAQALSHLLVRTDAVKAAMKGVAWAQERTRLIAKLTGQGMGRIAAQEAAFQTLVGEVLAEELKARTAAERASAGTIFGAAKSFVSAFKRMATTNEFTEVVRAELNKLIEKAHNPERLKEGFAKVTFQAAVDADPQAAAVLAHMAANPKAVLTGSIVLAHGGSVYRNAANMLHDLDFVFNGTHDEAATHLAKAFPGSVVVNGFQGKSYKVDTHIVPPPGAKLTDVSYKAGKATYTVERDGQVIGRSWHDAAGEHKEGVTGTIVDFFTGEDRPAAQTIPFTTNGQSHSVKAVSAASIFETKFQMGREKDMLDYVRYVPEAGRKLNTQTTPAGVQSSENATPNDDQIAAAHAYIKKVLGPKVKVEFAKDFDAAGEWVEADNLIKLALHSGPGMLTVAHHESMHALWSQLVKNSPDAASKLAHVLSSPDIRARLEDLLHNEPLALAQLSDPEERVAYAYQFWAAGALDVDKPATTLFAKFRKFLRKVFGYVRDSETALDIMTAFHDGKLAEPSAAGRVIEGIMAREKWNEDVRRKFDATIQHVYSSVNVSNKVLRSSESADARSLGEELFSNPGEERDGQNFEGYLNARTRVVRQYTNFLYKGVKGLSQRDLEATAKHMQLKTPLEGIHYAPVREAVKGMRALTKRYFTYATKDAGLQLEYLGDDHYPRVWDLSELVNNRKKFVAMLLQPKYAKTMRSALDMVNANKNAPQKTMEDLAAMMHEELMQKNGVDEKGMETERGGNEVLSPFFASQKERSFKWLDDEDVEPFLEKDLIGAMSRYLHQGIRAAEYSRRFGNGGAALRERLAMIGDEWVNPETGRLENRTKPGRIQGELIAAAEERGITGVEADKWVARRMEDIKNSVTAHEGSLGSEISPAVRKITSAAMAYQNLRLLPLSLFAAFADPLSIAARGPGVRAGFEAFTNGLRDVWLRWKDAASDMPAERRRSMWDDMAETAGVVDSHMFLEQMGKAHTSEFMTDFARKANRALFMANGLTAWDRSMRVTATKFAALFLQDHKSLPDKHSARWLAELGLKPEDIPLDADGKLIYDRHTLAASRYSADMNADEKAAVLTQATAEIEKVHYALTRWVEGAVLTPNAAQRPTWGSDPRWAVLFHLKQFTYSFQDTVIKRAFNEASHGNMNPIGALAASVPTMMVSDILKGFVMGGGSMPAYMKTWGLGDHMMHAVSRAGLAGTSQFGLDALRDPASLFGPTVEQAIKVVASPSEIGKNLVDAIPGVRFLGPAKDLGRAMSD